MYTRTYMYNVVHIKFCHTHGYAISASQHLCYFQANDKRQYNTYNIITIPCALMTNNTNYGIRTPSIAPFVHSKKHNKNTNKIPRANERVIENETATTTQLIDRLLFLMQAILMNERTNEQSTIFDIRTQNI